MNWQSSSSTPDASTPRPATRARPSTRWSARLNMLSPQNTRSKPPRRGRRPVPRRPTPRSNAHGPAMCSALIARSIRRLIQVSPPPRGRGLGAGGDHARRKPRCTVTRSGRAAEPSRQRVRADGSHRAAGSPACAARPRRPRDPHGGRPSGRCRCDRRAAASRAESSGRTGRAWRDAHSTIISLPPCLKISPASRPHPLQECSPAGRASVSKTEGRGVRVPPLLPFSHIAAHSHRWPSGVGACHAEGHGGRCSQISARGTLARWQARARLCDIGGDREPGLARGVVGPGDGPRG